MGKNSSRLPNDCTKICTDANINIKIYIEVIIFQILKICHTKVSKTKVRIRTQVTSLISYLKKYLQSTEKNTKASLFKILQT